MGKRFPSNQPIDCTMKCQINIYSFPYNAWELHILACLQLFNMVASYGEEVSGEAVSE